MSSCCSPEEYGRLFTPGRAQRSVQRYLSRGLTGTARRLADAVTGLGVRQATILEVGGGAGTIHADLLRLGAASAVNVELSPGWETSAQRLLSELELSDRVERRLGDFVVEAPTLAEADIVLLHRAVCCYPAWEPMLATSRRLATRTIGLTFPVDRWWTRIGIRGSNLMLRLWRSRFRAFVHPADAMLDTLTGAGFVTVSDHSGAMWRTVVLTRQAA